MRRWSQPPGWYLTRARFNPLTETGRMQTPDPEFSRLMEHVRAGCPRAIDELLRRYGGNIRVAVRRKLDQRLRPQFDSLDFQQDVWASFFGGAVDRCTFESPAALVRFLEKVASNKVVEEFRRRVRSRKHNVQREQSLDQLHFVPLAPEVAARNPTPSQVAMANESWERMLHKQPPHYRRILELRRLGHTQSEIAEQLDLDVKMIQRVLHQLRVRGIHR